MGFKMVTWGLEMGFKMVTWVGGEMGFKMVTWGLEMGARDGSRYRGNIGLCSGSGPSALTAAAGVRFPVREETFFSLTSSFSILP